MKLFWYYALHTVKNQLKKLFKTWVLIFLVVCMLIGGIIGIGAASLEDLAAGQEPTAEDAAAEDEEPSFLERTGLDAAALVELIADALILAILVYEVLSADKNGSRIFTPADVNLLFPSPLRPQAVLMFRLATQMGMAIFASIYMLFQLPNLVVNFGLGVWAALAMIAAWGLTIMLGKLLQILIYLLSANTPRLKNHLRRGVYLLLAAAGVAYFLYWKRSGAGWLPAAAGFFNAPLTRYLPLWGWLKGFLVFAMAGEASSCLLCLGALVLCAAALIFAIRHVKADFYEDAMAKSEETAELLEQSRADQSGRVGMKKRKKDRSERLRRDGMRWGAGANVFFFKTLYNRFRFAHLGYFTKTTETYLVAAAAVALGCRYILHVPGLIPAALTLSGFSFFRALGNPLEQDTKMGYFVMIPESTEKKLFYSLMGGSANCLLDALPALVLSAALLGEALLDALAWLPFIVSIDLFATAVGTFIDLSVPVSAGKNIKQVVQIMFIYFGLLPDIAIMAVGLVLDRAATAALEAAVLNLVLGFLFFGLCPRFLDPPAKRRS